MTIEHARPVWLIGFVVVRVVTLAGRAGAIGFAACETSWAAGVDRSWDAASNST